MLPHIFGGLFGLIEVEGAVFWVEVKGDSTEGGGEHLFFFVWRIALFLLLSSRAYNKLLRRFRGRNAPSSEVFPGKGCVLSAHLALSLSEQQSYNH